jgi:hypothetical protein
MPQRQKDTKVHKDRHMISVTLCLGTLVAIFNGNINLKIKI